MITGFRALRVALGVLAVMTIACQRVALLAPSGSTITLTSLATTVPLNGTTSLIAQVIEPAGTPPQRGTLVTFTTSLGTIQPIEAETDPGGRVLVTFKAGTLSGTATIFAVSGGVTTGATGAIKIAVGAASVASIGLTATPPTISPGGKSTITATLSDAGGTLVAGVPVTFTTDNGSVNPAVANTDASGNATATLTTTKTAKVTATAGTPSTSGTTTTPAPSSSITVAVDPAPTVTITSLPANPTAGNTVTFTIGAQPGTGSSATIRDLTVNFGPGEGGVDLGQTSGSNIQVQHVYQNSGTYQATASATDTNGSSSTGSTVIVVGAGAIIARFTVSPSSPSVGTVVTFDASASTSASPIVDYTWTFGEGGATASGGSPTQTFSYTTAGAKNITLVIRDSAGRTATAIRTINVTP